MTKARKTDILLYCSIFLLMSLVSTLIYNGAVSTSFAQEDQTLIIYNQSIKNWDNLSYALTNESGRGLGPLYTYYRPLQTLSYIFEYSFWGFDARGYYVNNIILHTLTAFMIFWLTKLLFGSRLFAFFTSILFIAHPIHLDTVSFISNRGSILACLFLTTAFIGYIKGLLEDRGGDFVLSLIFYILALLSYEMSIIFPLLLIMYHVFLSRRAQLKESLIILFITLAYIIIRFTLAKHWHLQEFLILNPYQILPGFFKLLASFWMFLILPLRGLGPPDISGVISWSDLQVLFGFILFCFLIVLAFKRKSKSYVVPFSIIWLLICLLTLFCQYPFSSYKAGAWLYIASLGFFLIIGRCLQFLYKTKKYRLGAIIFAIVLFISYFHLSISTLNF